MSLNIFPKRALLSVSDKEGLVPFARRLTELGVEIYSTGGTLQALEKAAIKARSVSDITNFPEMMQGRIKTLHPMLLGAILGCRQRDEQDAKTHNIQWIDLVVCNLYPFEKVSRAPQATLMDKIENIDVGGPTMLRAAAKNYHAVSVVSSPDDYEMILNKLENEQGIDLATRERLSIKAFAKTAAYDAAIANHLEPETFPQTLNLSYQKVSAPRYGENPHQGAAIYQSSDDNLSVLSGVQHQGKTMSYNNYVDADASLQAVQGFHKPSCVIVKHACPCGISSDETLQSAFLAAHSSDPVSAFGGVVAFNGEIDEPLAEELSKHFFEIVLASALTDKAKACLAAKKNLRVITVDFSKPRSFHLAKPIAGGLLLQERDSFEISEDTLKIMTGNPLSSLEIKHISFAWQALKSVKSNAIVISKSLATLGISGGQVSRIDATKLALEKAGDKTQGAMLCSDAFFPFRDCIDLAAAHGIKTIVQPGGSIKDNEVIAACAEHGIRLVFTGHRAFFH